MNEGRMRGKNYDDRYKKRTWMIERWKSLSNGVVGLSCRCTQQLSLNAKRKKSSSGENNDLLMLRERNPLSGEDNEKDFFYVLYGANNFIENFFFLKSH